MAKGKPVYLLSVAHAASPHPPGYFTGSLKAGADGRLDPLLIEKAAAHEGEAIEIVDRAWRGDMIAAVRVASMLHYFGPEGIDVQLVEYHPAGGLTRAQD